MQPSLQELTKLKPQDHPKLPDGQILGLHKKGKQKDIEPSLTYQLAENPNPALLDRAFDILFEEIFRKNDSLTSYDN